MNPLAERPASRALVRLALALWLVAALAAIWEAMALQAPDSPFHAGVLAGPIGQLRGYTFNLGTSILGGSFLWPWLYPRGTGRVTLIAVLTGSILSSAALAYAATQGLVGAQLIDPRPDARVIVVLRALGHALLIGALCSACLRALRSPLER